MKKLLPVMVLLLAGCEVGPNYQKPDIAVPPTFAAPGTQGVTSVPISGEADLSVWWMQYGDRELQSLIVRALKSNLDLQTAASRLREARTQEVIAGAAGLPQVNASGLAAHLHSDSSLAQKLGTSSSSSGPPPSGGTDLSLYSLGFDATWELDIFGGVRRGVEAAAAGTEAALWQMRDGEVSLTAEIATDYVSLRATQARLAILRDQLNRQRDTLSLVSARASTGFVTQLDVNQQVSLSQSTAAQIPALEAQAAILEHAIAVLLAVEPNGLAAELDASGALPPVPAGLPVGLPSDLLRRRPDVRAAERKLAAATAEIGVATADLYPKFNLLGGASLSSNSVSSLFNSSSFGALGLGSIMWPVFNGGRTEANIHGKEEERNQAYYAYQQAVLIAVKDVEDALARYVTDQRRQQALTVARDSARSSVELALQQYKVGLTNYVTVLSVQTSYLNNEDQLAQADAATATDLVSVYKALGGGWGNAPAP